MNTNDEHDFFSWLKNSSQTHSALYDAERYAEGCCPKHYSHRIRVIYENEQCETLIQQWLTEVDTTFAVAIIERNVSLKAIELAFIELNNEKLQQLTKYDNILVFQIKAPLPNLNENGLLLMDMDSTAIQIECIDELAKLAGVGEAVAQVTERAMAGELDFEASLRLRVKQLAGASEEIIQQLIDVIPLTSGLTSMCNELQKHNWNVALASGGFTPFVDALKQKLQLTAAFANTLEIKNGLLTGNVNGQIVDAQFKADVIKQLADKYDISTSQTMAIGDGANDIPMLKRAYTGVAFYAKPIVNHVADYQINKLNLNALLYLTEKK